MLCFVHLQLLNLHQIEKQYYLILVIFSLIDRTQKIKIIGGIWHCQSEKKLFHQFSVVCYFGRVENTINITTYHIFIITKEN